MKVICPIRPRDFEEFKNFIIKIGNRANIIEIWVDRVADDFFEKFKTLQKGKTKFLAVCKQPQEKGHFTGSTMERVKILNKFLSAGGNFVDLDITQSQKTEIKKIDPKKLILSFHNFNGISDLENIFEKMKPYHPKIYKFAVTVNTTEDLDKFMVFINKFPSDKKAIFTTMGKYGKVGRQQIGKKFWGQFFALDEESKTAAGQMTLDDLV